MSWPGCGVRGLDWRTGLAFGAVGIPAAYLGTLLNHRVSPPVLLLVFAAVMLVAAAAMLLNERRRDDEPMSAAAADRAERGGGVAVATRPDTARRARLGTER